MSAGTSSASPFEEQAFAVFSSAPSTHAGAPTLLECLNTVQSAEDGAFLLDQVPAASALSDDEREWVRRILCDCGFELRPDGSLKASDEVLDRLRRETNTARKRAHAEAAATLKPEYAKRAHAHAKYDADTAQYFVMRGRSFAFVTTDARAHWRRQSGSRIMSCVRGTSSPTCNPNRFSHRVASKHVSIVHAWPGCFRRNRRRSPSSTVVPR